MPCSHGAAAGRLEALAGCGLSSFLSQPPLAEQGIPSVEVCVERAAAPWHPTGAGHAASAAAAACVCCSLARQPRARTCINHQATPSASCLRVAALNGWHHSCVVQAVWPQA
jgi:hypothetical protein